MAEVIVPDYMKEIEQDYYDLTGEPMWAPRQKVDTEPDEEQ